MFSSAWRQAGESKRADRKRRLLYFFSLSTISRSAAHRETAETPLLLGEHLRKLSSLCLEAENYKCICPTADRGFHCCSEHIDFALREKVMSREMFDVQGSSELKLFQMLVDSPFLQQQLWTDRIGTPVLLTPKQRSELHAVQLFAPSAHVPVRSYGVEDTLHTLNTESLWETCTSSVAGLFASMPLTDEAPGRVKRAHERTVDVRRIVFEQFDPRGPVYLASQIPDKAANTFPASQIPVHSIQKCLV